VSRLLISIQPREGGVAFSEEIDVPPYVTCRAAGEACVFHIRDIWGESEVEEIIDSHTRRLP